nr:Ig-like domain-containing protein [Lachnospiraceae bacterium]
SEGNVTAVSRGKAVITASSNNGKTDTCEVNVYVPGTAITIPEEVALVVGGNSTIAGSITPGTNDEDSASIKYSSDNSSVATIDGNGKITAVAAGTANITASFTSKYTGDICTSNICKVTVTKEKNPVKTLTMDTSKTVNVGDAVKLSYTATGEKSGAVTDTFTWSSSDGTVATVDASGNVTGIKKGSAKITITASSGVNAVCDITVKNPATDINVSDVNVTAGDTVQVTYKVITVDGTSTDDEISFEMTDNGAATLIQSGNNIQVTGIKGGTETLTITAGNVSKTCTITVSNVYATDINILKNSTVIASKDKTGSVSLEKGGELTLSASLISSATVTDPTITWETADDSIVSLDKTTGDSVILTGVKTGGPIIVRAKTTNNIVAEVKVQVRLSATGVGYTSDDVTVGGTDNAYTAEMSVGDSYKFTAALLPEGSTDTINSIELESGSDYSQVGIIGNEITVDALKPGTVEILATTSNGQQSKLTITINKIAAESISVIFNGSEISDNVTLNKGDAIILVSSISPENTTYKGITWTANNEKVSISESNIMSGEGVTLTALSAGDVIVTATSDDNEKILKKMTFHIVSPVKGISLSSSELAMQTGDTQTLTANLTPTDTTDSTAAVKWTSSVETVATVSSGKITALKEGTTTITATITNRSNETYTATCKVTVTKTVVAVESVDITSTLPDTIYPEDEVTFEASVSPFDATNKTVTWASSDTDVMTIDSQTGVATAVAPGSVTITATCGSKTDTVNVTVSKRKVTDIAVTVKDSEGSTVTISDNVTSINEGGSLIFKASADPSNATYSDIIWTAFSNDYATGVKNSDGTFTVTALKVTDSASPVTFTVGSDKGDYTETISINITPNYATGIKIYNSSSEETSSLEIKDNASTTVYSALVGENISSTVKGVTWTSADTSILRLSSSSATMSSDGILSASAGDKITITGLKPGTAKVIASCETETGTATAELTVTVTEVDVTSVSMNISEAQTLEASETLSLKATVLPENATDKTVTWTTSDSDVLAFTDSEGNAITTDSIIADSVTVKAGRVSEDTEVTVTAKAGTKTATLTITVEAVKVTAVDIDLSSLTLDVSGDSAGKALVGTITPSDAGNQDINWEISDTSIATLSSETTVSGAEVKVIPKKAGTVTVTAKSAEDNSIYDTCNVSVNKTNTSIKFELVNSDGTSEEYNDDYILSVYKNTSVNLRVTLDEDTTSTAKWSLDDSTAGTLTKKSDEGNVSNYVFTATSGK